MRNIWVVLGDGASSVARRAGFLVAAGLVFCGVVSPQSGSSFSFTMNFSGNATASFPGTLTGSGNGSVSPIGGGATLQILGTENDSGLVVADLTVSLTAGDQLKMVFTGQDTGNPELDGTAGIAGGSGVFTGASGTLSVKLVSSNSNDAGDFVAFDFTMAANGNIALPFGTTGPLTPTNLQPTNGVTCSDPVSVNNGNLFQTQVDLVATSRGPSLAVERSYNSLLAASNSPFGYGWTDNYNMSLTDVGSAVIWTNQSGATYVFSLQGTSYTPPPGLSLTLTKDSQGYTLRSSHGMQWRFNTKGVLQSITDRNLNAITLQYDSSGRLAQVTDSLSRALSFSYDGNSHITQLKDFSGRQVAYSYDSAGSLVSVTDAAGNITRYTYFQNQPQQHLLQTVTKPNGNSTSFQYGSGGQISQVTDSGGRNMNFQYTPASRQTTFTDPRGFTASYTYDALGNVTRVINSDGSHSDATYTADGRVATQTDETGNVTSYTYDSQGNVTSITDPTGALTTLTYEPVFNQVASLTEARRATTNFQYDSHGNLITITRPLGVVLRFTYDSSGDLLTATDGEGNTTTISNDSQGNPVKMTDPLGNSTRFQFDSLRRLTAITDALNGVTSLQWDALDRVVHIVNPLGNAVTRTFDGNGNLSQFTDAKSQITKFSYDALDNLAEVDDAAGGATQYGYSVPNCGCSSGSDLISFRDGAGFTHTQTYDYAERLTQSVDQAGNQVTFAYNARGDLIRKTDANGSAIQYEYDADRRLVHKIFPDGSDARFSYDRNGNLTSAVNPNGAVSFTYDPLNRVTTVTDSRFNSPVVHTRWRARDASPQGVVQYTYDGNGRRTSMSSLAGIVTYTYDAAGDLTAVTDPAGAAVRFTYDALNRPLSTRDSNGVTGAWQYDAAGEVTSLAYNAGQTPVAQFAYSYDKNGNTTSIAGSGGNRSFQFDVLDRLTAATATGGPPGIFRYDAAGNRTASATDANYSYDATGRLTAAEGARNTFDKAGNLIQRVDSTGTTTYSYDFENHLTGVTFPDGTSAVYLYDALGRRIQKTVKGVVTRYLYDGTNILLEFDQNGAAPVTYTHGPSVDQPLIMERDGQTYFYHADRTGSIAAITDGGGTVKCAFNYDPFGRTQPCALANPYGFAGREFDPESGLVYMRARYYDPGTGRFLSNDPLDLTGLLLARQSGASGLPFLRTPQQLNRYSYAVNNPSAFRDPSGLRCSPIQGPLQFQEVSPNSGLYGAYTLDKYKRYVIVDSKGNVLAQGAALLVAGNHGIIKDVAGQFSEDLGIPNGQGGPAPPSGNYADPNDYVDSKALDAAETATWAQIYNALLAYLDPLGNQPRMPDPVNGN